MEKTGTIFTDLVYNPETGEVTRQGRVCGALQKTGYLRTSYNNKLYMNHRIAWYLQTGEWPKNQIDHINGDRSDNRWCNLREVSNQQNQFNRVVRKDSSTGLKGVYPKGNRFRAAIWFNGREKHLGYFETAEEAKLVYDKHAREIQGPYFNEPYS